MKQSRKEKERDWKKINNSLVNMGKSSTQKLKTCISRIHNEELKRKQRQQKKKQSVGAPQKFDDELVRAM